MRAAVKWVQENRWAIALWFLRCVVLAVLGFAVWAALQPVPAHAYNAKQIESFTRRSFRGTRDQCVPMAKFARKVAEADGYNCTDGHERKWGRGHRFLILEKGGKRWEILH